jgi:peptidoglycan/LPS O-acetylase OafA/YrhL
MADMQGSLSLWMDVWRLLAVLLVFLTHVKNDPAAHVLHPFGLYGSEGVAIFFVLSGALVATSAWKPGVTVRSFAVARLSRLWSVALPAILLTIVLDSAGRLIAPAVYLTIPAWTLNAAGVWQALGPALFVNTIPYLATSPGSNGPFWSLCPEAWCYLAFAVAYFARGTPRIFSLLALVAAAGELNLMLAPIWGCGVVLAIALRQPPATGTVRMWKSAFWATLILTPVWMIAKFRIMRATGLPSVLVQDYVPALAVMTNIWAFKQAALRLPASIAPALHAAIARSFSLYLIQAPVLYILTATFDAVGMGGIPRVLLILALPPAAAVAFASQTEVRRWAFANWLLRAYPRKPTIVA